MSTTTPTTTNAAISVGPDEYINPAPVPAESYGTFTVTPPYTTVIAGDYEGNLFFQTVRVPAVESQFDRLLWLIGLHPEERAFVRAALKNPAEARGHLMVLCDWLDEHGRGGEAQKLRLRLANGEGE